MVDEDKCEKCGSIRHRTEGGGRHLQHETILQPCDACGLWLLTGKDYREGFCVSCGKTGPVRPICKPSAFAEKLGFNGPLARLCDDCWNQPRNGTVRVITKGSIDKKWLKEWKTYLKVAPVIATQIDEDFQVRTLEGIMQAKAGDYLCMGPNGDIWPVKKDIFEDTYELATVARRRYYQ